MRILVTGGTGYIGSHTVVALQKEGHDVYIVDNLSNSRIEIIGAIERITGIRPAFAAFDLVDGERARQYFETHELDGVIHFAAYKSVSESMAHPLKYYRNNIGSLVNVLECMAEKNIRHFVFSSSCTVYGQPDTLPVSEKAPVKRPFSVYGNTKRISEEIIEDAVHAQTVTAISLRYFNPIGAHESALIGELPLGVPDNLMPYITQTAIGKREALNVYGNDYATPDGTAIRDYIHIVDLAEAHVAALDRIGKNQMPRNYEVFNLGTGRGYTVMEVIRSFEKVSGVSLKYRIVGRRPGDVEKVWADPHLANTELGWKAKRGLDEMTLSAWNWEKALAEQWTF
jgi:UDP-glucose 4-epimerase